MKAIKKEFSRCSFCVNLITKRKESNTSSESPEVQDHMLDNHPHLMFKCLLSTCCTSSEIYKDPTSSIESNGYFVSWKELKSHFQFHHIEERSWENSFNLPNDLRLAYCKYCDMNILCRGSFQLSTHPKREHKDNNRNHILLGCRLCSDFRAESDELWKKHFSSDYGDCIGAYKITEDFKSQLTSHNLKRKSLSSKANVVLLDFDYVEYAILNRSNSRIAVGIEISNIGAYKYETGTKQDHNELKLLQFVTPSWISENRTWVFSNTSTNRFLEYQRIVPTKLKGCMLYSTITNKDCCSEEKALKILCDYLETLAKSNSSQEIVLANFNSYATGRKNAFLSIFLPKLRVYNLEERFYKYVTGYIDLLTSESRDTFQSTFGSCKSSSKVKSEFRHRRDEAVNIVDGFQNVMKHAWPDDSSRKPSCANQGLAGLMCLLDMVDNRSLDTILTRSAEKMNLKAKYFSNILLRKPSLDYKTHNVICCTFQRSNFPDYAVPYVLNLNIAPKLKLELRAHSLPMKIEGSRTKISKKGEIMNKSHSHRIHIKDEKNADRKILQNVKVERKSDDQNNQATNTKMSKWKENIDIADKHTTHAMESKNVDTEISQNIKVERANNLSTNQRITIPANMKDRNIRDSFPTHKSLDERWSFNRSKKINNLATSEAMSIAREIETLDQEPLNNKNIFEMIITNLIDQSIKTSESNYSKWHKMFKICKAPNENQSTVETNLIFDVTVPKTYKETSLHQKGTFNFSTHVKSILNSVIDECFNENIKTFGAKNEDKDPIKMIVDSLIDNCINLSEKDGIRTLSCFKVKTNTKNYVTTHIDGYKDVSLDENKSIFCKENLQLGSRCYKVTNRCSERSNNTICFNPASPTRKELNNSAMTNGNKTVCPTPNNERTENGKSLVAYSSLNSNEGTMHGFSAVDRLSFISEILEKRVIDCNDVRYCDKFLSIKNNFDRLSTEILDSEQNAGLDLNSMSGNRAISMEETKHGGDGNASIKALAHTNSSGTGLFEKLSKHHDQMMDAIKEEMTKGSHNLAEDYLVPEPNKDLGNKLHGHTNRKRHLAMLDNECLDDDDDQYSTSRVRDVLISQPSRKRLCKEAFL